MIEFVNEWHGYRKEQPLLHSIYQDIAGHTKTPLRICVEETQRDSITAQWGICCENYFFENCYCLSLVHSFRGEIVYRSHPAYNFLNYTCCCVLWKSYFEHVCTAYQSGEAIISWQLANTALILNELYMWVKWVKWEESEHWKMSTRFQ